LHTRVNELSYQQQSIHRPTIKWVCKNLNSYYRTWSLLKQIYFKTKVKLKHNYFVETARC